MGAHDRINFKNEHDNSIISSGEATENSRLGDL